MDPFFSPPSIDGRKVSILLYTDNLVLISLNKIGLHRMLVKFGSLCKEELLQINYAKSKILIFGKKSKSKWFLDGHPLEQVSSFKYLGIHLSGNLTWAQHLNNIYLTSARNLGLLKSFFYSRGGQLINPAFKIFISQNIPQILYGADLWGESVNLRSK